MPDVIDRDHEYDGPTRAGRLRRRSREAARRSRTIRFDVSEAEHGEVATAAGRADLTYGAFAAEATLAAARGLMITPDALLRDLLSRFDRVVLQVRRIGVNLNQAVAALNATGQSGGDLVPYAAHTVRAAARLEAIGEELRTRIVSAFRKRGQGSPSAGLSAGPPSGGQPASADKRGSDPGFAVR